MAVDIKFITGIRCAKDELNSLNNMTFIYDVNWSANNSKKPTLPVCFFHVKSQHEVLESEISQREMLFYNSALGALSSDPALDSGLLNVVADNIVIKPKVYKLDVVIPYHNLTLLDQSFNHNAFTDTALMAFLLSKGSKVDSDILPWFTLSQPYVKLIKDLLKTLLNMNYSNFSLDSLLTGISQSTDYNKESLEVMWRMRHIVKMKAWNDWHYKYLAIHDVDITKEGTEDGVYEATLTLQELPIISMYGWKARMPDIFKYKNILLDTRGKTAIAMLDLAGSTLGKD